MVEEKHGSHLTSAEPRGTKEVICLIWSQVDSVLRDINVKCSYGTRSYHFLCKSQSHVGYLNFENPVLKEKSEDHQNNVLIIR